MVRCNQSFTTVNNHDDNTHLRLSNSTLQCNLHAEMRLERSHKNHWMITFPSNAFKCVSRFQKYDRLYINTKQKISGSSLVRVSIFREKLIRIVHFFSKITPYTINYILCILRPIWLFLFLICRIWFRKILFKTNTHQ